MNLDAIRSENQAILRPPSRDPQGIHVFFFPAVNVSASCRGWDYGFSRNRRQRSATSDANDATSSPPESIALHREFQCDGKQEIFAASKRYERSLRSSQLAIGLENRCRKLNAANLVGRMRQTRIDSSLVENPMIVPATSSPVSESQILID